jgi:hypothetical protein
MMMVVKEPGVDVALAQRLLNGREVHRQRVILHDREAGVVREVARGTHRRIRASEVRRL